MGMETGFRARINGADITVIGKSFRFFPGLGGIKAGYPNRRVFPVLLDS
jgi:hypothetical protein